MRERKRESREKLRLGKKKEKDDGSFPPTHNRNCELGEGRKRERRVTSQSDEGKGRGDRKSPLPSPPQLCGVDIYIDIYIYRFFII